jgi:hypothetical protein
MDQAITSIVFGKAFERAGLVLTNPGLKIAGYADVEHT